jgi:DNA-binding NtrC family response regulator
VLARLREEAPKLPVILMSGFSSEDRPPQEGVAFLQKPMTVADLGRAASKVLEPQECAG